MSTALPTAPAPAGAIERLRALWRRFEWGNELAALLGIALAIQLFPRRSPLGVYALGISSAATLAIHTVAIILVYRSNRFINFAQLQLGVAAGQLFTIIIRGQVLINMARGVCGCIDRSPGTGARMAAYVVGAVISIALAGLVSVAAYTLLLRRFAKAPRLMLLLVTVFLGQALAGLEPTFQQYLMPEDPRLQQALAKVPMTPPHDVTMKIDAFATFHLSELLLLVTAFIAVVGIDQYFRRSDAGIAIRASAESPTRAGSLGVNTVLVTARVWLFAGLLAGAAGVFGAFAGGSSPIREPGAQANLTIPVDVLAQILAVCVIARFTNLRMAALGAIALGVLRTTVQYAFSSTAPLDAFLVVLVAGLLLVQRARGASRADREDVGGYEVAREVRPIPAELRSLPQVRKYVRGLAAVSVAVVLGLPWALSAATTTLVSVFMIYAVIGLSLLVLTGWAGQVSLGQFGFAAIGAWVAAASGLPMLFAVPLAGIVGAAAAVATGVPALKLKGLNLAISTLAFAVSAKAVFIDNRYLGKHLPRSVNRPRLLGMDFDDHRIFYYLLLLLLAAACAAVTGLRRSRTGRVLIATRANEQTSQAFGISLLRARLTAFAIAGFLAAFAGALFSFHQRQVTPESFGPEQSLQMFTFAVIGGLGGLIGPLLGFTYMCLLTLLASNPVIKYTAAGSGALLLLVAAPGGIAQVVYDLRDAMLRRLAIRLRIPVPSLMGDRKANQAVDRALLEEKRAGKQDELATGLKYKPTRQWALDRYGAAEGTKERVGTNKQAGQEVGVG